MSNQTVNDILGASKHVDQYLEHLDRQLQEEYDKAGCALTGPGHDRNAIRRRQKAVNDARAALSYQTLVKVDQSEIVAHLQQRMNAINAAVDDVRDHLRGVERCSGTVASLTDAAARIVGVATRVIGV